MTRIFSSFLHTIQYNYYESLSVSTHNIFDHFYQIRTVNHYLSFAEYYERTQMYQDYWGFLFAHNLTLSFVCIATIVCTLCVMRNNILEWHRLSSASLFYLFIASTTKCPFFLLRKNFRQGQNYSSELRASNVVLHFGFSDFGSSV